MSCDPDRGGVKGMFITSAPTFIYCRFQKRSRLKPFAPPVKASSLLISFSFPAAFLPPRRSGSTVGAEAGPREGPGDRKATQPAFTRHRKPTASATVPGPGWDGVTDG